MTTAPRPTGRRARITDQGKVTVPKAVRDTLGPRPGDDLEFIPTERGFAVEVRPRRSILELAGLAADVAHLIPSDPHELHRIIEEGIAAQVMARAAKIAAQRDDPRHRVV